jgi:hypothetical protein
MCSLTLRFGILLPALRLHQGLQLGAIAAVEATVNHAGL